MLYVLYVVYIYACSFALAIHRATERPAVRPYVDVPDISRYMYFEVCRIYLSDCSPAIHFVEERPGVRPYQQKQ